MDLSRYELSPDKLCWQCDPTQFDFECTRDLARLGEFIGQDRAIRAVQFGLKMGREGYNIFVVGLAGTGKTSIVKSYIKKLIEQRQVEQPYHARDWCYLYNFDDADKAQIVSLPQGKGKTFRDELGGLLQRIKDDLTKAFTSEEYKTQRNRTREEAQAEQQRLFRDIGEEARREGFMLEMTPVGPALIPLSNGKPMTQADYFALDEGVRQRLDTKRAELLKKLQTAFERARELETRAGERLRLSDKQIADYTVSRLFESLLQQYHDLPDIVKYLNELKNYTLENVDAFKEPAEQPASPLGLPLNLMRARDPFLPFQVNVFVDNSGTDGPPVITEANPNYPNLFGKIERRFLLGGYLSDHTMLKAGALQLANGGYLLLSTTDVLTNPGVWPALKRAIKNKEARIEDPFEQYGFVPPQGLRPQPMPIDVKVVLIGDGMLYQLLTMYDEEFWEIFRVKADFDYQVDRSPENMVAYASFIAGCCEECELRHFDRTGVARVLEYASRMVSDQQKLSTRFGQIKVLLEEAEYWARQDGAELVNAGHVEQAIEERRFRHNLPDERLRELITRGTIMIDIDGAVVGQVNGLAVYSLGDFSFGKPSRITARTFLGRAGIINIEREAQLSGHIHDKGVLILGGYLGWKYAQDKPISISASLTFEQSYEGVEGDSASSTELYALLSSIAEVPVKQNVAVTGSVNQRGEVQPIGGVNQKIEGFFDVCNARGLTGDQGVMIPATNVQNLMLRDEVIGAVKQGKFHIYAVSTIDEGIQILTGLAAGERGADGKYPEGTINDMVDKKLREMAEKLTRFARAGEKEEGKERGKV